MDSQKLKLQIGAYVFEAEGDRESVAAQLEVFKSLVQSASSQSVLAKPSTPFRAPLNVVQTHAEGGEAGENNSGQTAADAERQKFARLFTIKKKSVSLLCSPQGDNRRSDGLLLILFGQRLLRNEEIVGIVDLKAGLIDSGLMSGNDRIDEIFAKVESGLVSKMGQRIGSRYRLTNIGMQKAKEIGEALLETL